MLVVVVVVTMFFMMMCYQEDSGGTKLPKFAGPPVVITNIAVNSYEITLKELWICLNLKSGIKVLIMEYIADLI